MFYGYVVPMIYEEIFTNPFFWAFISMFGLVGAIMLFSGSTLKENRLFIYTMVTLFDGGKIIMVLPMCNQPRFALYGRNWIIGGTFLLIALIVSAPMFKIKPLTVPNKEMNLITTGLYGYTRNPIYLGDLLLTIGISFLFQSIIGLLLVPIWWIALLFHILAEEQCLERELGQLYLEYKKNVKGRILPGLPF